MSALSGLAVSGRLSEIVSRYDDKKGIYEFKLQRWMHLPSFRSTSQSFFKVGGKVSLFRASLCLRRSAYPNHSRAQGPCFLLLNNSR